MEGCTCTDALGNTGVDKCEIIMQATQTVILMSKYKEDGSLNFIDVSTPATLGATIKTLTQAVTDPMSRLYPLPVAENVTMEKTETTYETAPSNRRYKAQDGIRTNVFNFMGENSSFRFLKELKKFGCGELVFFIIDNAGGIFGQSTVAGKLYGVPVARNTFDAMLSFATDTTVQKIALQFDTEYGFNDANWRGISAKDLGYSATVLRGIISVNAVVGAITTTTVVVNLSTATNSALNPTDPFVGLQLSDWSLRELDPTVGVIVIATAVESLVNDGEYTLTYPAATSGDVLEGKATRNGYEVIAFKFVIP
jgi:hypothetical protein